jgi:hypothetical protein
MWWKKKKIAKKINFCPIESSRNALPYSGSIA